MCGICGLIDRHGNISRPLVERMTEIMRHRGPDAGGVWLNERATVALGNRRLAILDLDPRSNQPFISDDGTIVLTYNGEIYNFRDLRRKLEAHGHHFRTESDTEVIVHAYQEWGLESVHRFRGMFAFALHDAPKNRTWLVRDRLGIKPLLYYEKDGVFAFASELQQFTDTGAFDADLDLSALYDCLTYQYIPAPKTAFRYMRKLEAGHWLLWENGAVRTQRYWDVPVFGENAVTEDAAIKRLRDILDEAVALRLIADVPVGTLLSGGIDSSAVSYYAQKNHSGPLHTFSVGFDVAVKDELAYAGLMARQIGSDHVTQTVRLADVRADATRQMFLYGEPHGDSSIFPTRIVSRIARNKVTVALSGDGGDEVFWGYKRYLAFPEHNGRHHFPLRGVSRTFIEEVLPMTLRGRGHLMRRHLDGFELWTQLLGGLTRPEKERFITNDLVDHFADYDEHWAFRKYWRDDLPMATRLQYLDLKTYLADDILVKVDRASMSVSLEARVPLLDHKLAEEVFSWPDSIRSDGRSLKYIFRKAMNGILPDAILNKPKHGFSIPWREWLRNWNEFQDVRGDGQFFKSGERLPQHYTTLMLQHWLQHQTGR
jgi:asparagine synthase (glutamine-hydrolysing)